MASETAIREEVILDENPNAQEEIKVGSLSETSMEGDKPNYDGAQVTISEVSLIPKDEEKKSQDGQHIYRSVLLRVGYDNNGVEFFGGLRQFNHEGKWSEPTFFLGGASAIADLFQKWKDKTGKTSGQTSLKAFLQSLVGMKCVLKSKIVSYQGREYRKNVVERFL